MKPEHVIGTLVAVLLFAVVWILIPVLPWPPVVKNMSSNEWASWVQALGSIFAIVGTGWGVLYQQRTQHEHAIAMAEKQTLEASARACMQLERLAQSLNDAINRVKIAFESPDAVRHWHSLGWVATSGLDAFEHRFSTFDASHLPQGAVYLPVLIASNLTIFTHAVAAIGKLPMPISDEALLTPLGDIDRAIGLFGYAHLVVAEERKRVDQLLGR